MTQVRFSVTNQTVTTATATLVAIPARATWVRIAVDDGATTFTFSTDPDWDGATPPFSQRTNELVLEHPGGLRGQSISVHHTVGSDATFVIEALLEIA